MQRSTAVLLPIAFLAAMLAGMKLADFPAASGAEGSQPGESSTEDAGWGDVPRFRSPSFSGENAGPSESSRVRTPKAWLSGDTHPTRSTAIAATVARRYQLAGLSTEDLIDALPPRYRDDARRYRRELVSFEPRHRRSLCWGPDTPLEVVETYRRIELEGGLSAGDAQIQATQFLLSNHWSRTATNGTGNGAQGLPVTLTWSIVPDGTTAPNALNVDGPSDLRGWLAGLLGGSTTGDLTQQAWFAPLLTAIQRMEDVSGVNFVYEPNDDGVDLSDQTTAQGETGIRGDIRLFARPMVSPPGVFAFAYYPDHGDVVLNSNNDYFGIGDLEPLIYTLSHEIGHSLGLAHVCPADETKLMEPFASDSIIGPQFDDIYSLQRLYGDPLEVQAPNRDNDTVAKAASLTVDLGSQIFGWLSIDDDSDIDHLKFNVPSGRKITLRLIPSDPFGGTYLEGPQTSNCNTGTAFDPRSRQDLTLELLNATGTSVLAQATSAGAGQTEEIPGYNLHSGGDFLIRINGDSNDTAQLYQLEVELEATEYALWAAGYPGLDADPEEDDDGDSWSALAEYLFDTHPLLAGSAPQITPSLETTKLRIVLPTRPARADATIVGETSTTLSGWTTTGVTTEADGFSVPRSGSQRFLRLRFALTP